MGSEADHDALSLQTDRQIPELFQFCGGNLRSAGEMREYLFTSFGLVDQDS